MMNGGWIDQDVYTRLAARIGGWDGPTGLEAALRAIGGDGPAIARKISADFRECRLAGMTESQAMLVAVADAIDCGHEAEIDAAMALFRSPTFPWVRPPAR